MELNEISKKQIDDTVIYLLEIAEDDEFYCFNFDTEFQQRKFIEHANKFRGIANLLQDTYNKLIETNTELNKAVELIAKMNNLI